MKIYKSKPQSTQNKTNIEFKILTLKSRNLNHDPLQQIHTIIENQKSKIHIGQLKTIIGTNETSNNSTLHNQTRKPPLK